MRKAIWEASAKWWSSARLTSPKLLGLIHLSSETLHSMGRSANQVFHRSNSSSPMGSSQPSPSFHRSWINFLAGKMTGARNPNGSYAELVTDNIPRRVACFSLGAIVNLNVSVSTHHCIPRVRSIGNRFLSKSRSRTEDARSLSGMAWITSLLLLSHLVRRNPPAASVSRRDLARVIAALASLTDFRQSST